MIGRWIFLAILIAGAGAVALTSVDRPQEARASLSGVLSENYATIADLTVAAPVIVVAEAGIRNDRQSGRLPFTEVALQVHEVLKGGLSQGDTIRVLETGGTYTPIARDGSRPNLPTQQVDFEGVPVMHTGGTYILFLRPYLGEIVDGGFAVLGVYQGKLKVGASGHIEYTGRASEISGSTFKVQRDTMGRAARDVIAEVRERIR